MSPIVVILFAIIVAVLFYLGHAREWHTSMALWIPVAWMLIVGSREVSVWLHASHGGKIAARYTEGNPIDAAAYGVLMLAGLLVLNFRSRKVAGFFAKNGPLLLFVAFCLISVLWSDFPFVAVKRWIKGIGSTVMVLLILTDPQPLEATKRFFACVAFILLPLSALLILLDPGLGTEYDPVTGVTYFIGVTTQKNALGLTCLVCGLGSLWLFLCAYEERRGRERVRHLIAYGTILLTALWLLRKCDSMTSFSCLVIAGTVMIATTNRWVSKNSKNIHILVAGAVAVAVFAAFIDASGGLLRLLGRNATLTGRTDIWKAVLFLNPNPFLGTGYESFWLGDRLQRVWEIIGYRGIAEAHNGYLETYINLGWMGLALLLMLLASGYRRAVTALRNHPYAGRLSIAFFTASVIYNLSEAGFKMMSPLWIAFILEITVVPAVILHRNNRPAFEAPATREKTPRQFRVLQ
jgi:O-antigen ligase